MAAFVRSVAVGVTVCVAAHVIINQLHKRGYI